MSSITPAARSLTAIIRAVVAAVILCLVLSAARLHAADHFIPSTQAVVNGTGISPGDTITLQSGPRGKLLIQGVTGNSTNRVIIRNDPNNSSPVVIDGQDQAIASLHLVDILYVTVDGSARAGLTYGIRLTSSVVNQNSGLRFQGSSRFGTVRYVEIDGQSKVRIGFSINDKDVSVAAYPGHWVEGFKFEFNYVHDNLTEGFYLGNNQNSCGPNGDQPCASVRNLEVANNLVQDTGWDGINIKHSPDGGGLNKVHHNTLRRVGKIGDPGGQRSGIALLDANVDVYNNWVEDAGHNGIQRAGGNYGSGSIKIYNNVVLDPGVNPTPGASYAPRGIHTFGPSTAVTVYNNTVIRPPGIGINIEAATGTIRDNIVADAGEAPVSGPNLVNNRTGTVASMAFANAAGDNFHLTSTSPARNAGSASGFPATDYDGVARPQESAADQGAFEFVGGSSSATFTSVAAEDGRIRESGENTNVGGGTSATEHWVGDNSNKEQGKLVVSFDTSSLPDGATILTATLRLKRLSVDGSNPFTWGGQCRVDIRNGGFNGNTALQAADFEAAASATNVTQMSSPAANGDWSTGALSSTGRTQINKTGKTQVRVYFQTDDNNNSTADRMWFQGGEAASGSKPEFVITYQ